MPQATRRPWTPRLPLRLAERHVDYQAHRSHIDARRVIVETAGRPLARRIGFSAWSHGFHPAALELQLADRLQQALTQTAAFGYREAQRELRSLRESKKLAERALPDAGNFAAVAASGRSGLRALTRKRAEQLAFLVAAAILQQQIASAAEAAAVAERTLHRGVLEAVGELLNLGRTAGVLAETQPPRYAMRSEQLDENTCDACDAIHGTIVEVDSAEYYDILPPAECFGGGRCRGIMVYGDEGGDLEE